MSQREDREEDEGFGESSRYTAHLDRGWSLLERGDFQQARSSAHQAQRLRPDVPDAAMLMAAISLAEGDPEAGLEWYERAIETDSDYVDAQIAAAQVLLYDLDDPQRAIARLEQARELDEATMLDQIELDLMEVEALLVLGQRGSALGRLSSLSDLDLLAELLDPAIDEDRAATLVHELGVLPPQTEGEEDELEHSLARLVQLGLRVIRLHVDLGQPGEALAWLRSLLQRFDDDAELWYLANETAFLAGETIPATHAALKVMQLDTRTPTPEWVPKPSELYRQIHELIAGCNDPSLRELVAEPGFVVLINEAPPVEMVLEGIDPRVRALALASRSALDPSATPILTGIVVYRQNVARLVGDAIELRREIELAVLDELAVFHGFDDVRRAALGLPPLELDELLRDGPTDHVEASEAPEPAPAPKQRSKKADKNKTPSKKSARTGAAKPSKPSKPAAQGGKKSSKKRRLD